MSAAGPAAEARPVGVAAFASLMAARGHLRDAPRLALGVSGGADSVALLFLAARWRDALLRRRGRAPRLAALTVDHGLRPAAADARLVARHARALGASHHVLRHSGPPPRRNVQARARDVRYGLLAAWCRAHGVPALLVAHHLEDQAETFMLRLARGSGVDGLAAMAAATALDGVRLCRPLLTVPRARLRATLRAAGLAWVDDPANTDARFARTRMRRLLDALAAEGLDAGRLGVTAAHMARARRALDAMTSDLLRRAARLEDTGWATVDAALLARAPEEISLRALARLLMAVSGSAYRPRLQNLQALHAAVCAGDLGRGRTLAGCKVLSRPLLSGARPLLSGARPLLSGARGVVILREAAAARRAAPVLLRSGAGKVWDGRYEVFLERGRGEVRALGPARSGDLLRPGERAIPGAAARLGRHLPVAARPSLPALWRGETLLTVPHLDFRRSRAPVLKVRLRRPAGLAAAP